MTVLSKLDPIFLTTRETFPGEKSFADLAEGFFASGAHDERAALVRGAYESGGVLVHMANPEQVDDLFAHIARETRVRYLSTSYLHRDITATVYAIGRGTGLLLDASKVKIEHISTTDSDTVTDAHGNLVVSNSAVVPTMDALHDALVKRPQGEWSEVNVSFEGPAPLVGFFALDGVMSKIYASALFVKAGRRLPIFVYNREANTLTEFTPTVETLTQLIEAVPAPALREHYRSLLPLL